MIEENLLIFQGVLFGGIFFLAGIILHYFPPKKINYLYGYRTKSSMKNQERWDFAQQYSAKILMILGGLYILLFFLLSKFNLPQTFEDFGGLVFLIVLAILIFWIVEKKLKNKFG